jgi:hypothetical protein
MMKNEAIQAITCPQPDENENPNGEKEPRDHHRKTGSIITIVSSALANLSDGYQQSLASSTNVVFSHVLGKEIYTSDRQTRISNSLLVGSVIGILIFGYVSDRLSRKGGMLVTSGLVVVGSLMSALAFQVDDARHMLWFMTIARGTAGVGVGGKPKSTSIAKRLLKLCRRISHLSSRRSRRLKRALRRKAWPDTSPRLYTHGYLRRSNLHFRLPDEPNRQRE